MISVEEQKDLDIAKAEVAAIKIKSFEYMQHLLRLTEHELIQSGYGQGLAQAILTTVQKADTKIKAVWKAHTKQYPD